MVSQLSMDGENGLITKLHGTYVHCANRLSTECMCRNVFWVFGNEQFDGD